MKSAALLAADAHCRRLAGRHYENFWVLSALPPGPLRRHVARLYAYCRTTDDLGDESAGDATAELTAWRAAVAEAVAGGRASHPVLFALRDTALRFRLPAAPFLDLVDANLQDQRVSSYEDWDGLRAYCLLSAAPVGRLVLRLFEVWTPDLEALSDDVCIGLQLANFAQDVSVDGGRGRTYLLQCDLRTAGPEGAVRSLCERAGELLESGRALERRVPARLRIQLALYRLGGQAVLRAIERDGYRTFEGRPAVGNAAKLALVPAALGVAIR